MHINSCFFAEISIEIRIENFRTQLWSLVLSMLKSTLVIQGLLEAMVVLQCRLTSGGGGLFPTQPLRPMGFGQVGPSSTVIIVMYVTTIRRCTSQVTRFPQLTALDCMHRLVVFQTWPRTFFDRRHHSCGPRTTLQIIYTVFKCVQLSTVISLYGFV